MYCRDHSGLDCAKDAKKEAHDKVLNGACVSKFCRIFAIARIRAMILEISSVNKTLQTWRQPFPS